MVKAASVALGSGLKGTAAYSLEVVTAVPHADHNDGYASGVKSVSMPVVIENPEMDMLSIILFTILVGAIVIALVCHWKSLAAGVTMLWETATKCLCQQPTIVAAAVEPETNVWDELDLQRVNEWWAAQEWFAEQATLAERENEDEVYEVPEARPPRVPVVYETAAASNSRAV